MSPRELTTFSLLLLAPVELVVHCAWLYFGVMCQMGKYRLFPHHQNLKVFAFLAALLDDIYDVSGFQDLPRLPWEHMIEQQFLRMEAITLALPSIRVPHDTCNNIPIPP